MRISTLAGLTGALILGALVGCSSPTDTGSSGNTTTVTPAPRVLTLNWTGTTGTWSNVMFGFYPLSGKTISDAQVTWAYNAAANAGLGGEWHYKNLNASDTASTGLSWTSPSTDFPSAADTWTTASSLTDSVPTATDNTSLKLWQNGNGSCIIYLKQVVLTYSDNSTETLTFTSDGSAPVKSVYNSTTTTSLLSTRVWTYNDNTSMTMTNAYIAAPF